MTGCVYTSFLNNDNMIERIKKGSRKNILHGVRGVVFNKKQITYNVCFFDDCAYNIGIPDQLEWNKLLGIGYFPGVHRHSFRIGWRYNGGFIELGQYQYNKGVKIQKPLCKIATNRDYEVTIHNLLKGFWVVISDFETGEQLCSSMCLSSDPPRFIGFLLGPYFGGDTRAPHDMKIYMQRI